MFLDCFLSLFSKSKTIPLPQVKTVEDIQAVLLQIKYVNTYSDKLVDPEVVWYEKSTNCVGFASVASPLLQSIGKDPKIIAITCKDERNNHVITAFLNPTFDYFSDQNLRHSEMTDIDSLVKSIKHNDLVSWRLL